MLANEVDDAIGQLGEIQESQFVFKTLTKLNAKQQRQLRSLEYWASPDLEP